MSVISGPEKLTDEQRETLEKAAYTVIKARQEAAAMLARAGVAPPAIGWFGSRCGVPGCGCTNYTGDGCPCLSPVTTDPGASPPGRSCGHRPSQHRET
jgi:hypothetical protein